jgi:Methyltransferase domain
MEKQFVPPGHFYSPIPSQAEVKRREAVIWGPKPRELASIDLNEQGQLLLFDELKKFYGELPFDDKPKQGCRYYFTNEWFGHADAIILYCLIRHLKPKRIVEVGSGYSSAVILDTNDLFFDGSISCTFIEPNPDRLYSLLRGGDRHVRVLTKPVQDVGLDHFASLSADDILFIDSSHVSKVCSDVNWLFFQGLPVLGNQVFIHFHDVLYPFEYPKEWVYQGVAWNEAYLLRAFLQYNNSFSIQFFNSFLLHFHRDRFRADLPRCVQHQDAGCGSLWLRKDVPGPVPAVSSDPG